MMTNPFDQIDHRLQSIESILVKLHETTTETDDTTLSVKEAAEFLHVTEQSVRSYIKRGLLSANRIGRKYVINKGTLESMEPVKSLRYQRSN